MANLNFFSKRNQSSLLHKIEQYSRTKHQMLVNKSLPSEFDHLKVGTLANEEAISVYIKGVGVQLLFPSSSAEPILVAQYEHFHEPNVFRSYNTSKYEYTGCWAEKIDILNMVAERYGLKASLPTNGKEHLVKLSSETKSGETMVEASLNLLNQIATNKLALAPRKPITITK